MSEHCVQQEQNRLVPKQGMLLHQWQQLRV